MPKLWEIAADVLALDALIEEVDGDLTDPRVEAAWLAWMGENDGNEGRKIDGYVNWIRFKESQAMAAKAEAVRYAKIMKTCENIVAWQEKRLKDYLILTKRDKILTETGRTVAIVKNGGVQALDIASDLDPATLDPQFVRIVREVNTEAVRKHVEEYGALPFATLKPRGTSLRIR